MENLVGGIIFFSLFFSFLAASCAHKTVSVPQPASAFASPDAATDTALGILSQKGGAEAQKQAKKLEGEDAETKALQELHRREKEEEERRLQRTVTEDITQQRVTRT